MRRHCCWLALGALALALASCWPVGPDGAAPARRTVAASFTIHFDESGGRVVTSATGVDVGSAGDAVVAPPPREVAGEDDYDLTTLLADFDPPDGTCIGTDWRYDVQLTNLSGESWNNPIAQLYIIVPAGNTACNSDSSGKEIPGFGAPVAEWAYEHPLAHGANDTQSWGFAPLGGAFTVMGHITVDGALYTCFGKVETDPTVCNGHGDCVADETCNCDPGWVGFACLDAAVCNGIPATEHETVCSGHGTCIADDTCICDGGWGGVWCEEPPVITCNGIPANDPLVCSGHGLCEEPDTCACFGGWIGLWCQIEE